MSTCNQLDLQTLGFQPVMPKNLPDHWVGDDTPCTVPSENFDYCLIIIRSLLWYIYRIWNQESFTPLWYIYRIWNPCNKVDDIGHVRCWLAIVTYVNVDCLACWTDQTEVLEPKWCAFGKTTTAFPKRSPLFLGRGRSCRPVSWCVRTMCLGILQKNFWW